MQWGVELRFDHILAVTEADALGSLATVQSQLWHGIVTSACDTRKDWLASRNPRPPQ